MNISESLEKKVLVTSALPYANGSIHIGHLVEYIQTDIFVRFLKLIGKDVIYMCADDTHGTPIMMKARSLNIKPEDLISKYYEEHQLDFRGFFVKFDCYHSTHSQENEKHSTRIFQELKKNGHIFTDNVEQYYCEQDSMFLSDRYIKGTCPNCKASEQYGDVCESCSMHYDPTDLISPHCALCGTSPVRRSSTHYFFRLADFKDKLLDWTSHEGRLQTETLNSIREWLDKGLKDWDISRDSPYFGFKIPGETDKYFYVWLDAPVGYIATTERYCKESGRDFDSYWFNDESEIYHFIGKDIIYFHTLFWPAMLMGSGYSTPRSVYVHGFLTVNGKKMSKTRGTFITARTYLNNLDPQYLRYYYASKLSANSEDIDLNLEDFRLKVNADLINNIVNLGSRAISMVYKNFQGIVGDMNSEGSELFEQFITKLDTSKANYLYREFVKATRSIIDIADQANKYFSYNKPWFTIKDSPSQAHQVCAFAINAFKLICTALKPVLPKLAADVESILNLPEQQWKDAKTILPSDHKINKFKNILTRVEKKKVDSMIKTSRIENQKQPIAKKAKNDKYISIEDFSKLDLRVGEILTVETVRQSQTLYRVKVDIGRTITIYAGIRSSYPDTESLIGKKILILSNLKPKMFKGIGISEGMLLAAAGPGEEIILAEFSEQSENGWRVM